MTKRVALATCTDVHGLARDDRPLVQALRERGIEAEAKVWNDPNVNWDDFDLTIIRSTWDYPSHYEEFIKWVDSVPRLLNSSAVVKWNSDRRYLKQMDEAGVPVVDTIWLDPNAHLSKRAIHSRMPAFGDFVVKPVVSSQANEVGRYQPISAQSRAKAIAHAMELLDSGRWVMIQPYVTSIDTLGEACLTFVNDEFQHAVRRKALLGGTHRKTVGLSLYANDTMTPVEATERQLEVAKQTLEFAHQATGISEPFLYARVDLVNGEPSASAKDLRLVTKEGPLVTELELTDPSLELLHSGTNPTTANLADAIVARLNSPRHPEAPSVEEPSSDGVSKPRGV